MNVRRIGFLGTRTSNFEATGALFRDVLGLPNVHAEAGWSIFDDGRLRLVLLPRTRFATLHAMQQDSRSTLADGAREEK